MALLACLLLPSGAYSIGVSFSASGGGGSVGLNSIYNLDDSVSASEGASASFGQVGITDTRSVSGTGNVQADQSYSGSGGYAGSSQINAEGVSGTLQSNAALTPQSLTANQGLSLTGNSVDTGMSLANKGDSANLGVGITSGTVDSNQVIQTGSVHNGISANINAPWAYLSQSTSISGIAENAITTLQNPNSEPIVFNTIADSYNGIASFILGGKSLNEHKEVTGSDGSGARIDAVVTNSKNPITHNYKHISDHEIGYELTADDADYISVDAYATNGKNDQIHVSTDITKGSLNNYLNDAYFDGTKAIASQSFSEAEGDKIVLNQAEKPNYNLLWDVGGHAYCPD